MENNARITESGAGSRRELHGAEDTASHSWQKSQLKQVPRDQSNMQKRISFN